MLCIYPACFLRAKGETGYSVHFPDLTHLATCGDDVNDAMAMAIDCLAGYIHTLIEDNEDLPVPSRLNDISIKDIIEDLEFSEDEFVDGFLTLVAVDVEEYARLTFGETSRSYVALPKELHIAAMDRDIYLSEVLEKALREEVKRVPPIDYDD